MKFKNIETRVVEIKKVSELNGCDEDFELTSLTHYQYEFKLRRSRENFNIISSDSSFDITYEDVDYHCVVDCSMVSPEGAFLTGKCYRKDYNLLDDAEQLPKRIKE